MSPEVQTLIAAAFERFEERPPEARIQILRGLAEIDPEKAARALSAVHAIREAERRQLELIRIIDPED